MAPEDQNGPDFVLGNQRATMAVMVPIPPFRLRPEPLDEVAEASLSAGFRWASPEIGYRHQLGGEPSFASAPPPACSSCNDSMTFYGQLDSINDQICLADAGVVTVWVCFGCHEAEARVESN